MLRSCNLLRQNVLNFGIKRIDVVFKRTLANIAFHCNKIFHFKRTDFAIKLSDYKIYIDFKYKSQTFKHNS